MDGLRVVLLIFTGAFACDRCRVSGSAMEEKTAEEGDDVTIFCDCRLEPGEFVVWYRNCSHENQPTFVLKRKKFGEPLSDENLSSLPPRFDFVRNEYSGSFDLLITNITLADEGLYFCGAERLRVTGEKISSKAFHRYCNAKTRIVLNSREGVPLTPWDAGVCWPLLFFLCPALAALSSLLSSLLTYRLCRKTADGPGDDEKRHDTREQASGSKGEDVCYAALEIHPASHGSKKKRESLADFTTYSAINASRV